MKPCKKHYWYHPGGDNQCCESNDMAAIAGVDVLFVGPSDLTMALGIFNQFDHAVYQKAIKDVVKAVQQNGKAAGVLLQDVRNMKCITN